MAILRLIISGVVAFGFYAAWAWYANSLVESDPAVLLKAALVQGSYSGAMTLLFTAMLEFFFHRFGTSTLCLSFITPRWSSHTPDNPCATVQTVAQALDSFDRSNGGKPLPGIVLVPLPALVVQSILVIGINVSFNTPNLWLTVLPSILFSAIYGYSYSFGLSKKQRAACS